jgi:hypothetical protein
MSLEQSRRTLYGTLTSLRNLLDERNCAGLLQQAEDWWGDYKELEKSDTFKKALRESRLTVSQRPLQNVIGTSAARLTMYSAKNLPPESNNSRPLYTILVLEALKSGLIPEISHCKKSGNPNNWK